MKTDANGNPLEPHFNTTFTKAATLVPMQQVETLYANLKCGNWKTKGCKVQMDFPNLYYCRVCMAIQALGTSFEADDKKVTDTMIEEMADWQHKAYNERAAYNQKFLDNYPRGATG